MLTMFDVQNPQGDLQVFRLDDDEDDYVVANIEGLDPVKATLVTSSFANQDGSQYHSSKRESRNIKITIELNPDYIQDSVSELRSRLYRYFMPKTEVKFRFYLDNGDYLWISGRVESFETPLFTNEPTVVISIFCFNPDFFDPRAVFVDGMTTSGVDEMALPYSGTVETGVNFTLNVNRALSSFSIYHRPPDGILRTMDFVFSTPLSAGDVLRFSSIPGAKGVTLTHGGSDAPALYTLSPQSPWLELQPGDNSIRVYTSGAAIPYIIDYTNKHGGM